ncbi:Tetratricopeptide repeat protein [Anatilimnocola aggregata]|uniref:Tetratricopeptide repeat protein n=1 Tax=Anatilimnocola aggregata TaxID=2528021 RepID=A0A517YFZ7_9BACT|nr:DUF6807 family protein [Anatilimnocola aggregata]QDU29102.1 Tetratricopeptide repeat protein [Anatilimnocola aggregata]
MLNATLPLIIACVLVFTRTAAAEVSIVELDDRLRVSIDGQLFTEWRHKEWVAPFLYPVVGPNGETVTRHFPMRANVPGEDADHPWHRSIRFSHSDVNGFNFWWAPGKERAGHTAEIKLERIERITSGKTGEVVFWNQWLGDGKIVLREKVRLAFLPLENWQLLMDYDLELQAADQPVLFGDKRDGGLLVRVAGSMKVEDEKGNKFQGSILNSRGDRNADAWGKQAEWADYVGPDASGKTVGIAMFDHPSNLRFPTHWHARMYGLITANRFGTDHFKAKYDDHKTVVCAPAGKACPACLSHSGDYTIPAQSSLTLRHRVYFHHGDSTAAKVADQYRVYTADPAAMLVRLRVLQRDRKWKELIEQFGTENFETWPAEDASDALHLRGQAHSILKNGKLAEADFKSALKLNPSADLVLLNLADNYANNLGNEEQALATYRQLLTKTGKSNGWLPIHTTIAIARLLTDQVKPDEALATLQQYGDMPGMAPVWRIKMLRAYGHAYAAQGKEQESLAKFREALELESQP